MTTLKITQKLIPEAKSYIKQKAIGIFAVGKDSIQFLNYNDAILTRNYLRKFGEYSTIVCSKKER